MIDLYNISILFKFNLVLIRPRKPTFFTFFGNVSALNEVNLLLAFIIQQNAKLLLNFDCGTQVKGNDERKISK